jgi:hypothetical protein
MYNSGNRNNRNGGFYAPQNVQADLQMPSINDLGGQGQVPWVRFPFYPTSPFTSTNPLVGTQTRFYGATVLSTDNDYVVNTEIIRTIQFDIPCRMVAINGAACDDTTVSTNAAPTTNLLNCFLFGIEYTTGDKLMTANRLASTVVGDMRQPGEIGGTGYTIDQGAALVLKFTPLTSAPANFRIDITLVCLEIRGQRNFGV